MTPGSPRFLDSNVLLRYLVRDDEAKAHEALSLLLRVSSGETKLETSQLVLFDVIFTLDRHYRMPRDQIRESLTTILDLPELHLDGKEVFARVLPLFVDFRVSFADTFNVATMEARRLTVIYSWDRDFDRFPGIYRVEPTSAGPRGSLDDS